MPNFITKTWNWIKRQWKKALVIIGIGVAIAAVEIIPSNQLTTLEKQKIIVGRECVSIHRENHTKLYEYGWYPEIHNDHTPLLNVMLRCFETQGFNSMKEFWQANEKLNKELNLNFEESWK